jgi:hypothetical protein
MAKILVNVWQPLIGGLKTKLDAACMKRDAYLDKVLAHEARMLAEEVQGQNSPEAREYIIQGLGQLKPVPVNLLLSQTTVHLVADACKLKNVPRDAFINRTLLFLVIRPGFFHLLYPEFDWKWAREVLLDRFGHDQKYLLFTPNTLGAIREIVQDDPFWYTRECIRVAREEDHEIPALHEKFIQKDALGKHAETAIGFNCYLEDAFIEGHPAALAQQEAVRRLLDELLNDPVPNEETPK